MIEQKDWVVFTSMLDIEQKLEEAKIEQQVKDHFKAQEEMRNALRAFIGDENLIPMSFVPCFKMVRTSYPRTVEGCMDWIAAGRPVFAKKIKVKSK